MPESVITADSFEVGRAEVVGVDVASSFIEMMDFELSSALSPSLGSLDPNPNVSGQESRTQGSTEQHPLKLLTAQE
jgi:hypothetical protein